MPWLKTSDQAAHHPIVLAPLGTEDVDGRIVNELFGWATRCAVQAAAYETNYVIDQGTAIQLAGGPAEFQRLKKAAIHAGYMVPIEIPGHDGNPRPGLRLVEEKDLFHMLRKEEREWENTRKRDTNNEDLIVPVRLRDGDFCRFCNRAVQWGNNKSRRGGTYDHLHARPAESPEDLVVACLGCNGRKKDLPLDETDMRLSKAPAKPFYGPRTVEFLATKGVHVTPGDPAAHQGGPEGREATTEDPGSRQAAPEGGSTAAQHSDPASEHAGPAGRSQGPNQGHQESSSIQQNPAARSKASLKNPDTSGRDGPGRDGSGSGRAGQGRDGRRSNQPSSKKNNRRRRRR